MIILSAATDILEAKLGGAITTNQLQCVASWRDISASAFAPDRTVIVTNGATPVNVVGSPAAAVQRVIDFVSVYNSDTVLQTVTIQFNANSTRYVLWSGSLAVGESVQYVDGSGWKRLTASGLPANGPLTAVQGTANEITVSTAAGVATISLPAALTFTGKTVTGGTFNPASLTNLIADIQTLVGPGAVDVTHLTTEFQSTGVADALTLANGTVGQIKTIVHKIDGGSGVLTPTTALGFSFITSTNAGESIVLQYTSAGWVILSVRGAVVT